MKTKSPRGFTLVEIMIATTLAGLLGAVALTFYVQSLKTSYVSEQELKLITSMRTLSSELIENGSRSHELVLYNSTQSTDITLDGRKLVVNDDTETTDDDVCPTGNFAVFVFYELPKPASQENYRISKLIGYYFDEDDGSLVRATIDLGSSPSTDPVEEIIEDNWSSADRRTIARRIEPLALSDGYGDSTLPQLFYRRANQSLAVCGQLLASATGVDTEDEKSHTRTFYFTVTVRS
jgi:prepilin-type N-terminal cleavage/methylation domain-containing protein